MVALRTNLLFSDTMHQEFILVISFVYKSCKIITLNIHQHHLLFLTQLQKRIKKKKTDLNPWKVLTQQSAIL